MNTLATDCGSARTLVRTILLLAGSGVATFSPCWAAADENDVEASSAVAQPDAPKPRTHLSEELRSSVKKVVVLPGRTSGDQAVSGSYGKKTAGFYGGAADGSKIGDGIGTEVGGVPVRVPFPILTLPGALVGGVSGKTKREIQEFRDALTADLIEASSQPLTNEALASDVFWGLRNVPNLESRILSRTIPVPEDTDAVLYVSIVNVSIDVEGKDAVINTTATATLRRMSDGEHLYENEFQYVDRDALSNWTSNENALWRNYANFARHYLGREISADVFDRVELNHELRPTKTDTVARVKKNEWHGVSRSSSPTLGWDLTLLGDDSYGAWAGSIDEADIFYDVEIYDMQKPVYFAKQVQGSRHTVAQELERCKTYRWSVRPSIHVGSDIKFGEWMRANSGKDTAKGSDGKKASEAPAYIRDFALLDIKCGRR